MSEVKGSTDEIRLVMEAVNELRTTVEQGADKFKGLDLGKVSKIEKALDEYESKAQAMQTALAERKAREEQLTEEIKELERALSRPGAGAGKHLDSEMKAYQRFLVQEDFSGAEAKDLRTNDNTQGGFLVPAQYVPELLKPITEVSPLRAYAKKRTTTSNEYQFPRRTGLLGAAWVGEAEQDSKVNSTYGLVQVPMNKMQVTVPVTFEQLRDSAFNMEAEIFADVVEEFGRLEGQSFISGNGIKKPLGVLADASVGSFNMGTSNALNADGILEAQGQIKDGYSLMYMLNRKTLAKIRTLKESTSGAYVWQPFAGGMPATIGGLPYISAIDMPDVAADAFPIMLGDFGRGFMIVDNMNIETIRDPFSAKRTGTVEFTYFRRTSGQVIMPEALLKLKVSA